MLARIWNEVGIGRIKRNEQIVSGGTGGGGGGNPAAIQHIKHKMR